MAQFLAKWWRRTPTCLGVSHNASGMTLVQWSPCDPAQAPGQRWAQEDWAPTEALDAPGWDDPLKSGAMLASLHQRAGLSCRRLAMGLPADRVLQQSLQVAADLPARDVRDQVNWSASQALDLAWDEVAFDYQIESPGDVEALSPSGASTPNAFLTVNWIACPMALVQAAQQMSRAARLHLQFLGVEPALMPAWHEAFNAVPADAPAFSPQWHMAYELARQGAQT